MIYLNSACLDRAVRKATHHSVDKLAGQVISSSLFSKNVFTPEVSTFLCSDCTSIVRESHRANEDFRSKGADLTGVVCDEHKSFYILIHLSEIVS